MALSTTHHDALFRALVSHSDRAGALLQDPVCQVKLRVLVDFEHLPELMEGTFINGDGAKTQCDALLPGPSQKRTGLLVSTCYSNIRAVLTTTHRCR